MVWVWVNVCVCVCVCGGGGGGGGGGGVNVCVCVLCYSTAFMTSTLNHFTKLLTPFVDSRVSYNSTFSYMAMHAWCVSSVCCDLTS